MSVFELPNWLPRVEVTLPLNITKDQLLTFPPFENWLHTLKTSLDEQFAEDHIFNKKHQRYTLRSIAVQSIDWLSANKIYSVKMEAVIRNDTDESALPGIVFLRGGSVAVLMIVRQEGDPDGKRWVIMTKQPRLAVGSLTFYEIPTGMIDDEKNFVGAAARDLQEETGLVFPAHELTDMTAKALESSNGAESHVQKAMYPSPGACDEYIMLYVWEGTKPAAWINQYLNRGKGIEKEKITVKLVPYEELWKEGARDAKTVAAWALYEALTRAGTLSEIRSDTPELKNKESTPIATSAEATLQ